MTLKNLSRLNSTRNGQHTWRLYTSDGAELEAFTRFANFAERFSPRTKKRYMEVVGRFLDYLIEAGLFGSPAPTVRRLNDVIDAYLPFLRDGSLLTVERIRRHETPGSDDDWLLDTAVALAWDPLVRGSFSNTIAALNHFLVLSASLAREEMERAELLGLAHGGSPDGLIRALRGSITVSNAEVHRMRQNSMLGSVAKFAANGMKRPRGLRGPSAGQTDTQNKDFPLEHLQALVGAATSWRDKALWLLLAASGIRTSEARNLLLEDILPDQQKVYVIDPSDRRFRPPSAIVEQPRFKGRAVAATYLFPPLRQWFFEALEKYLTLEYVPTGDRHLFQYVEPGRRGEPYVNASDTALASSFKKAAARAGVPLPFDGEEYTPHSLRHLYGVYMLNDYPVDPNAGRFGLPITDVQMLMGHAKLETTQKYARVKRDRLMQKLEASDRALLHLDSTEILLLPSEVAQRLKHKHD